MTILQQIIAHKRSEIEQAEARVPLSDLMKRVAQAPPALSFTQALHRPDGRTALIAEVKKASPSAGIIRADFDPASLALQYKAAGADCLSVLTDERFFQGHLKNLTTIRNIVDLPLLRKDFTLSVYQVYEARVAGADAILLIMAALTPDQIAEYIGVTQSLGMAALVEVHTEEEMRIALRCGATLIGINSRNLNTFVTDLAVIGRLAAMAPASATLVGESGIKVSQDVARLTRAGVKAILVGESLMRSPDIGAAVRRLTGR